MELENRFCAARYKIELLMEIDDTGIYIYIYTYDRVSHLDKNQINFASKPSNIFLVIARTLKNWKPVILTYFDVLLLLTVLLPRILLII